MCYASLSVDQVRTLARYLRVLIINDKVTAHASGKINQYIAITVAHSFDNVFEQIDISAAFASLRITHVQVHDRGTCVSGFDCSIADLLWGYRYSWVHIDSIACPCHRTGDNDLCVYCHHLLLCSLVLLVGLPQC